MLKNIIVPLITIIFFIILLISFKPSRKVGKWLGYIFGAAVVLITVAYGYFMRPVSLPPAPHVDAHISMRDTRASLAKLDFYLGAGTYTPMDIQHEAFTGFFNSYTTINELKIGSVLEELNNKTYNFTQADQYIEQAEKQNLRIRGHALVFGKLSDVYERPNLQTWLDANYTDDIKKREALQELVNSHIEKMLLHYKGRIKHWDVVNEPLALFGQGTLEDNVFLRNLGPEYIANTFKHAHAIDPQAKLFLNEQFDRYTGPRADAFIALVKQLKKQDVPVHGVGLQHHMLFTLAGHKETKIFIEQLASLGVDVEITELDARLHLFINSKNPHLAQAEYYRDTIQICFEIKACKGVTFWGLHDQDAWHQELPWMFPAPNAPYLFDENRNAKIAVQTIGDAVASWKSRGIQAP